MMDNIGNISRGQWGVRSPAEDGRMFSAQLRQWLHSPEATLIWFNSLNRPEVPQSAALASRQRRLRTDEIFLRPTDRFAYINNIVKNILLILLLAVLCCLLQSVMRMDLSVNNFKT